MSTHVAFRFETSSSGGYVPILGDSHVVSGDIASQNAGSSNAGIYYQVGGGGLNGRFDSALTASGDLANANAALVTAYDASGLGSGSWSADNSNPPDPPPLTSFLIPVTSGAGPIGSHVVGMMYSVGPVLGKAGITDPAQYAQIYTDAMHRVKSYRDAGHSLDGLRITMLSTGIYAGRVTDRKKLFVDSAEAIIQGVMNAVSADPSLADLTILINADDHPRTPPPKERYGFDTAATNRGLTPTHAGFDVPIT